MQNTYDACAEQYANYRAESERRGISQDSPLVYLLDYAGKVAGLKVLDAGCGEGYVSRILAERGAGVTGIDISPSLIEMARARDAGGIIDYQSHDLSRPLPRLRKFFDLGVSHMVLNDVPDYRGFISTLGEVIKPGGRFLLSMNSPYSRVVRGKVEHYFDSETSMLYESFSKIGIRVYFYHRTMEEYIAAFRDNGFLLKSLSDVKPTEAVFEGDEEYAGEMYRFPLFTVLEFVKAG